jgi:broad specificity phosphatase PhoE
MNGEFSKTPKIMLIRHAEKPTSSRHGVKPDGTRKKGSLTVLGWQRAGALACLLGRPREFAGPSPLAPPQFIFASKPLEHRGSKRSLQTVTPLAKKLGIKVNSKFPKEAIAELLKEVAFRDGVVLICWQREYLPQIANLILGNNTTAPQNWDDDRFDLVWVFEKDVTTFRYHFRQAPQELLAGDLTTPIL